jgi:hypothetical protein
MKFWISQTPVMEHRASASASNEYRYSKFQHLRLLDTCDPNFPRASMKSMCRARLLDRYLESHFKAWMEVRERVIDKLYRGKCAISFNVGYNGEAAQRLPRSSCWGEIATVTLAVNIDGKML